MGTELTSDILKDIKITDLQCTACHKRYLICLNDNYFETNELTAQLLAEIKETPTPDCGIRHFVSKHSGYSYTQIAEMFFTRLLPELKKWRYSLTPSTKLTCHLWPTENPVSHTRFNWILMICFCQIERQMSWRGCQDLIIHAPIRRFSDEKLTPILKSLR